MGFSLLNPSPPLGYAGQVLGLILHSSAGEQESRACLEVHTFDFAGHPLTKS